MKYLLALIFVTIIPSYNISFSKTPFHTSSSGLLLIKTSEGFGASPYIDSNGCRIIGHGHQIKPFENLRYITRAEAEKLLRQDVQDSERCLQKTLPFPLSQSQFDALVSFVFNVGCEGFKTSNMYYYLVLKDYKNMKFWWKKWAHDKNGTLLKGLVKRREKEIELFEKRL